MTIADSLVDSVAALIRTVSADVILPRFKQLAAHQISEKSPGEFVTIADHEAEERFAAGLALLDRSARVLGEEEASHNPALMAGLNSGAVWIVDPVDGTSNFAKGESPFGVIIAFAIDGVVVAGWLYDPVTDRMCHAVLGGGAFLNGEPIRAQPSGAVRPIAALATQFMPSDIRNRVIDRGTAHFDVVPIPRCAAEHYPRLCLGQNDIALFQRTLPWDHAAGALLLTEAGGHISRWDGSAYVFHDERRGIIASPCGHIWQHAVEALVCPETGLNETF